MSKGDIHCKSKGFQEAENSYSFALSMLETNVIENSFWLLIGRLRHKRSIARMKVENFTGALRDANFNIELNSRDVFANLIASVCYMRTRRITCSHQSYKRAGKLISGANLAIDNMVDAYYGWDIEKVKLLEFAISFLRLF